MTDHDCSRDGHRLGPVTQSDHINAVVVYCAHCSVHTLAIVTTDQAEATERARFRFELQHIITQEIAA